MRFAVRAAAFALSVAAPAGVFAQEPPPPIVANDRPMRFVLADGRAIDGTKVAETGDTIWVLTPTGTVSLRRAEISFVDFGAPGRCTTGAACSLRLGPGWTCMSGTCRWLAPTYAAPQTGDREGFDEDRSLRPVRERGATGGRHGRGLTIAGGATLGGGAVIGGLGVLLLARSSSEDFMHEFDVAFAHGLMLVGGCVMAVGLVMLFIGASQ